MLVYHLELLFIFYSSRAEETRIETWFDSCYDKKITIFTEKQKTHFFFFFWKSIVVNGIRTQINELHYLRLYHWKSKNTTLFSTSFFCYDSRKHKQITFSFWNNFFKISSLKMKWKYIQKIKHSRSSAV